MQPLGIGEEPARPPARGGYNLSYRPVQDEFNMATNHAWYAKTGWRLHGLFDILVVDYETAARENMKVVILKTSGKKNSPKIGESWSQTDPGSISSFQKKFQATCKR